MRNMHPSPGMLHGLCDNHILFLSSTQAIVCECVPVERGQNKVVSSVSLCVGDAGGSVLIHTK